MANINEMDIDQLLYAFQQRMHILIKREAAKPQGYEHYFLDEIENELMPVIDHIVDYEPSDDEITASYGSGGGYVKENALLGVMERR
ncbi:MAG: hypothetical protein JRE18_11565 [Deltaproteobacteria bacterium]|jgi:predicted AAA+ superfamily ATPase|nr:hypothetical protein [Deltaproteobacteria bacterium]